MAEKRLKVVEFYAGIGGFHSALKQAEVEKCDVVASFDINTNTRAIYTHNFPLTNHLNRNICGLTAEELDRLDADAFFLSPPCQPFTRQGNRLDNKDRRTDSFFHLMHTLKEMRSPPNYLLMENVKGFEISQTRNAFLGILKSLDYNIREFLLSPNQFGIPNSRLRFYLLAKRKPLQFAKQMKEGLKPSQDALMLISFVGGMSVHKDFAALKLEPDYGDNESLEPKHATLELDSDGTKCPNLEPNLSSTVTPRLDSDNETNSCSEPDSPEPENDSNKAHVPRDLLTCYLEHLDEEKLQRYLVPDKILQRYATALDIVQRDSQHSCCFTKAYGNYAVGTGSVLQHTLDRSALDSAFKEFASRQEEGDTAGSVECLRALNLRYFTPKEVANLMCFPESYSFPLGLTDRQCYMALGNSLNVRVVSVLIQYLFS